MEKQKNIPALRFPEFKGGWESRKMSDIARFSKGKGISKSGCTIGGTETVSNVLTFLAVSAAGSRLIVCGVATNSGDL